jgi:hypothetical protein
MNKSDITVGMTFYRIVPDRRGEDTNEMRELTVVKVGNKYMEMSNGDNVSIETLRHENKTYSQNSYSVYLTLREIEDVWEENRLRGKIRRYFQYGAPRSLTLDKLRKINSVLDGLE